MYYYLCTLSFNIIYANYNSMDRSAVFLYCHLVVSHFDIKSRFSELSDVTACSVTITHYVQPHVICCFQGRLIVSSIMVNSDYCAMEIDQMF